MVMRAYKSDCAAKGCTHPKTTTRIATASERTVGINKLRRMLSTDVLRHDSSGPTAVNSRSSIATGTFTLLKKGAPTVTLVPCTHSDNTGKSVPHSTVKQATSRMRLLNRKLDSRETNDSKRFSLRRWSRFMRKK